MGQEMFPLQLLPLTVTSRLLTRRSSRRQENLLRPITGSGDGVQVQALVLHRSAEDPLHHAAAAW
jgi:hypothetical protein